MWFNQNDDLVQIDFGRTIIMVEQLLGFGQNFWAALSSGSASSAHLWLYAVITLLVMVEGPVSILLAAGASSAGFLNPLPVFIAATLGNLIADTLWYGLGYIGKIDWLLRRRGWFGVNAEKLDLFRQVIHRQAVKLLIFAKLTNGLIVPVLIATGLARVPLRKWFPIIFVTNLLTSLVMVAIGYTMASSLLRVQQGLRYAAFAATLLFLLAASFYVRHLLSRKDVSAMLEKDE
uniref:VTT domain-containing protein n=1 Tax=Bellilinea caldifistulae TaxID=360411 RepID=A0A7C4PZN7_9CHLR